jgi:hypothetical protein
MNLKYLKLILFLLLTHLFPVVLIGFDLCFERDISISAQNPILFLPPCSVKAKGKYFG